MAAHVSKSPTGSIAWTDITPATSAKWPALALNANVALMAVSDGASFYTSPDAGAAWTLQPPGPSASSIAISDTAVPGPGPGINFAGLNSTYQGITAAAAQFSQPPLVPSPPLSTLLLGASAVYNLDPDTFARLIYKESSFNPDVTSFDGGQGIAQWTPPYPSGYTIMPFNPMSSIFAAAAYLSYFMGQLFGNIGLALAAYNAGLTSVNNYLFNNVSLPNITQTAVLLITGRTIAEWAAKGYQLIAADTPSEATVSRNSGVAWNAQVPPGPVLFAAVAMSGDGAHAVAVGSGKIWTLN